MICFQEFALLTAGMIVINLQVCYISNVNLYVTQTAEVLQTMLLNVLINGRSRRQAYTIHLSRISNSQTVGLEIKCIRLERREDKKSEDAVC